MKNLRHLCAALALTFMLALPAFAGDIELPGVTSTSTSTTTNQTQTGATSTSTTTSNQSAGSLSITETVLNLLHDVLSLL